MTIQFSDLLDFCFKESSPEKQKAIALKILRDDYTFSIVRGLNLLKKELGSRDKVEEYLDQIVESEKKLFFLQTANQ